MLTVRIQIADYEGDDFPEATRYPEFVAERVSEILANQGMAAKIDCEGGHPDTQIFGLDDALSNDIRELIKTSLWGDFCEHGFKTYKTRQVTVNGRQFDSDVVVNLMDADLREQLHTSHDWVSEQQFIDAYCAAHSEKFGKIFTVN